MEWHIITGSKGGVGKTLQSLLLSAYYIEKEKNLLVIDLNSMNVDFSRLLFYQKQLGEPITIPIPTEHHKNERLVLQKTYSLDHNGNPYEYIVASPLNPFNVYDASHFKSLLTTIKNTNIAKPLGIESLDAVIIDTNYHFCNIFAEQDGHYKEYSEGELYGESITIWFMWVYRQLENLIRLKYNDADVIRNTAAAIERNIHSNITKSTPFMHVFGPATLVSSQTGNTNKSSSIAKKLYNAIINNKDINIGELEQLAKLPVEDSIKFNNWVQKLDIAHIAAEKNGDPRHHFLDILIKATLTSKSNIAQCPRNIIPLSIYHNNLKYYTDANYRDIIAELKNFDIYHNFLKIMKRL